MKILFDHGTPAPLRRHWWGHSVDTAAEKGWHGLTNGDLIDRAEGEDYDVLITTDQSIQYQQNLAGRRLAVVVLLSTSWPYTQPKIEDIRTTLDESQPGELREVSIPMSDQA